MATIIKIVKDQSVFNHEEKLYISRSKVLMQLLDMLKLKHLYEPMMQSARPGSFEKAAKQESTDKRALTYTEQREKTKVSAREITINRFTEQYNNTKMDDTTASVDTPLNENSNCNNKGNRT